MRLENYGLTRGVYLALKQKEIKRMRELRAGGTSYKEIASITGYSIPTVRRYCKDTSANVSKKTVKTSSRKRGPKSSKKTVQKKAPDLVEGRAKSLEGALNIQGTINILEYSASKIGSAKKDSCAHYDEHDGICSFYLLSKKDNPAHMGKPMKTDSGHYLFNPNPIFCALCHEHKERRGQVTGLGRPVYSKSPIMWIGSKQEE